MNSQIENSNRIPNRLINETSPYLLQHAYNPVDWYSWGDEAFQKSISENMPILLSIGYSSCHWCHVMERESFEDTKVARIMNEHFVCIKLDREERPDIDHIYMDALQTMNGNGGWPLNIFLTPEKKPFYGGTYFPPQTYANRPSWTQVLKGVSSAYKNNRHVIEEQADLLFSQLSKSNTLKSKNKEENFTNASDSDFESAFIALQNSYDEKYGGFGFAPKFPPSMAIQFLFKYYKFYKNENALSMALNTLDCMLKGGIYDQIGGGIARYSTDYKWLAPHFEKMLYDNALFLECLCEAFKITKEDKYLREAVQTSEFIIREMMSPEKLFYSAIDADSEGEEGKYYCWDFFELKDILGSDFEFAKEYYDISEEGNWEHKIILTKKLFIEELALKKNIAYKDCLSRINRINKILFNTREKKEYPLLDDKILLSWNCLMQQAFIKVYHITSDYKYLNIALKNKEQLLSKFSNKSYVLFHNYKNGVLKNSGLLDDYAYFIKTLISSFQETGDFDLIDKAKKFTDFVIDNFYNEEEKYFFYTDKHQQDILIRKIEYYDSVSPSGNSVMLYNLKILNLFFEDLNYQSLIENMTNKIFAIAIQYPTSFSSWLNALILKQHDIIELSIVSEDYLKILSDINQEYNPSVLIIPILSPQDNYNITKGKFKSNITLYYLCKNFNCLEPFTSLKEIKNKLVI